MPELAENESSVLGTEEAVSSGIRIYNIIYIYLYDGIFFGSNCSFGKRKVENTSE